MVIISFLKVPQIPIRLHYGEFNINTHVLFAFYCSNFSWQSFPHHRGSWLLKNQMFFYEPSPDSKRRWQVSLTVRRSGPTISSGFDHWVLPIFLMTTNLSKFISLSALSIFFFELEKANYESLIELDWEQKNKLKEKVLR